MTRLEENLNYISTLPDNPTLQTDALKREFDKAGNVIKDYINSILLDEITAGLDNTLTSAKNYTDTAISGVSGDVTTLQRQVDGLTSSLQQQFNDLSTQLQQQITSSIPDMTTKYATGINFTAGVTQIFNQVFKINNLVHVYLEDNFTISKLSTGSTLCVLPNGYKPANAVKCLVLCINDAFTFHVTATINPNGAVIIPGAGREDGKVDAKKVVVDATYSL